jgi:hypothetical protein
MRSFVFFPDIKVPLEEIAERLFSFAAWYFSDDKI